MIKHALITGASSGIGREFAIQLHSQGYNVTLVARRLELLNDLSENLNRQRKGSAIVLKADLESLDSETGLPLVEKFIGENQISLLVNNAGRGSFGYFEKLSLEGEEAQINLNIRATTRLAYAVIPGMKKRKAGGIISVSSIAAIQPIPFMSTYAATKAFNLIHSCGLWYELKSYGIKVTVVCPGPVATEFGGVARVPGTVTGTSRTPVEKVVSESISAYNKGKLIVVPGIKARFLFTASRLVPTYLSTLITGKLLRKPLERHLN